MIGKLRSHPEIYLNEHINQIKIAVKEGILPGHSQITLSYQTKDLLGKVADFHDLGKGTVAFQEYIMDPNNYHGKKNEKAHSLLSLLLTLAITQESDWDIFSVLTLAAVVKGHHSRLPTISEKKIGSVSSSEWSLDNFSGGERERLLQKQLSMIDFEGLELETNICFQKSKTINNLLNNPGITIRKIKKWLNQALKSNFWSMSEEEAVDFRIKVQFIYSILLEADKAFLAVSNQDVYLDREVKPWQSNWVDLRIGTPEDNRINCLRQEARQKVINSMTDDIREIKGVYSLTAPTGIGKTLLAATWGLKMREIIKSTQGITPKIIVVLPFLSVIDQTAKEYVKLLQVGGYDVDGSWLLKSHSIADRHYADYIEEDDEAFFIDTWRSEVIITTYDQFLMSLMDPRSKYQMRFHNLCDSIIIMDEVQSLPCKLWQPLDKIFMRLSEVGNSRILLMSATLPSFIKNDKPLLNNYQEYFKEFKRYEINFRIQGKLIIDNFCTELCELLPAWLESNKRILITLNTRKSARMIRDALFQTKESLVDYNEIPIIFLSADVTPYDRLNAVSEIKKGYPCIVVSTQCIEAGIDIDMDEVFRDFAPLDSLIQIAGRCNREWRTLDRKRVTIVDLTDQQGKRYSEMIYDPIHLKATRDLVMDKEKIFEEEVLDLSKQYFEILADKKDTGKIHLHRFAYWQDDLPVRNILRGDQWDQHTFLVLDQDINLKEDMEETNEIENRWKRREEWKKLAGRIAMVSINVYAKYGFYPEWIAEPFLDNYWIVGEEHYSSDYGLQIELDSSDLIL